MHRLAVFAALSLAVGTIGPVAAQEIRTVGITDPGTMEYPHAGIWQEPSIQIPVNSASVFTSEYDTVRRRIVFTAVGLLPNKVSVGTVKLGEPWSAPVAMTTSPLDPTYASVRCSILDPERGFLYVAVPTISDNREFLVKVDIKTDPPNVMGRVEIPTDQDPSCIIRDSVTGLVYIATGGNPAKIVTIEGNGDEAQPVLRNTLVLDPGMAGFYCAVVDAAGYAYFASSTAPGNVYKFLLRTGTAAPRLVALLTLGQKEDGPVIGLLDELRGRLYFPTSNLDPRIVQLTTGEGDDAPVRLGSTSLGVDDSPLSGIIDPDASRVVIAVAGTATRLVNLEVSDTVPSVAGSIPFPAGQAASLDPATGLGYFGRTGGFSSFSVARFDTRGGINASRVVFPDDGDATSMTFTNHGGDGLLLLGLYEEVGPSMELRWASIPVTLSAGAGTMTVPFSEGIPAGLRVPPGTYWLAWQSTSSKRVAGYVGGGGDDGFRYQQPFGAFPSTLPGAGIRRTSDTWSQSFSYRVRESSIWLAN